MAGEQSYRRTGARYPRRFCPVIAIYLCRFGPDSEHCDGLDYRFDESRKSLFVEAIHQWYPELEESRLQPGFIGVRPSLCRPDEVFRDFIISGPASHGVESFVNLFGIDSPGLKSSLSLAEQIVL